MRISVLTNTYPPHARGGAGRIAAEQVKMLQAAGHEVQVQVCQPTWVDFPPITRFILHIIDLTARRSMVEKMIGSNPEVLITHNLTGCGFGTARHIQSRGIRWIHVLHDVQLFEPSGQLKSERRISLWQRFWSSLRRRSLGQPDLVISPTRWLLDAHRRRGFFLHGDALVLPNPGPIAHLLEREPHDPLRLLFVGHLSQAKGLVFLERLTDQLTFPFELKIVGGGNWKQRRRDHTKFYGPLNFSDVAGLMQESDVLLVPSQIEENQPTVILEAAAYGLPVVASRMGGIEETLGEVGFICSSNDLLAWKKSLNELRNPEVCQGQVRKMYALAVQHDPAAYAQRFIAFVTTKR